MFRLRRVSVNRHYLGEPDDLEDQAERFAEAADAETRAAVGRIAEVLQDRGEADGIDKADPAQIEEQGRALLPRFRLEQGAQGGSKMQVDLATEAKDIDAILMIFAEQPHRSVCQEREPLTLAGFLCPLGFHALPESVHGPIRGRRLDHVQMMEPHRGRVVIAHYHAAGRAGIERFPFTELLAVVACSSL